VETVETGETVDSENRQQTCGNEKVAALASPRKRPVEQGFLESFEDDEQTGSY